MSLGASADLTFVSTEGWFSRKANKAFYKGYTINYVWCVQKYEKGVKYQSEWEYYYDKYEDEFDNVREDTMEFLNRHKSTRKRFFEGIGGEIPLENASALIALGYITSAHKKKPPSQ